MKKLICIVLAMACILCLFAGCVEPAPGTSNNQNQTPSTTNKPTDPTEPSIWDSVNVITIAEALELCGEPGNITEERYYIRATIESIDNAAYGAMTIKDATGTISVYGTYSDDGSINYSAMTEKPFKGDEVLLHCILQNYNGTKEVKNARLIAFKVNDTPVDESAYTACTIADARNAAKGDKVKVEGVVARITYANGMIPAGLILVDNTASIYVYDGDLAARVSVGNKITILAEKDYWILDSEQSNASKFGYNGCNQLTSAVFVSSDNGSNNFDTNWIETSTVKEILDTPVSTDISTKIFKVTAQIKKAPGNGFVNYYINDLDGKTGTYTYTQCNGSDFAWLDAFDGKICTVYLTALNAKSTNSDCFWRFLPVAVIDENFDPSTVNAAEFGVKYFGLTQFQTSYTGDPALKLLTTADAELLGVTGIALSYTSSDSSIISIEDNVMHCHKTGSATITVTGTYGEQTFSGDITINVTINTSTENFATVKDAIDAKLDDAVTVKGIVGPSLVNKTGFYLIDETGVIAVETTADVLATLKIGNEVVLEAIRAINKKDENSQYGQTCLKNATVVVNNYGEHAYSTNAFKGNISVADFYKLDINVDYTTSVFTMTAYVVVEETKYYTNIYLSNVDHYDKNNPDNIYVRLYCSNASQYNWLKTYAGQQVTVEIAACNWNSKNYYTGCVLAVILEDGSRVLNTLNFNK